MNKYLLNANNIDTKPIMTEKTSYPMGKYQFQDNNKETFYVLPNSWTTPM